MRVAKSRCASRSSVARMSKSQLMLHVMSEAGVEGWAQKSVFIQNTI